MQIHIEHKHYNTNLYVLYKSDNTESICVIAEEFQFNIGIEYYILYILLNIIYIIDYIVQYRN